MHFFENCNLEFAVRRVKCYKIWVSTCSGFCYIVRSIWQGYFWSWPHRGEVILGSFGTLFWKLGCTLEIFAYLEFMESKMDTMWTTRLSKVHGRGYFWSQAHQGHFGVIWCSLWQSACKLGTAAVRANQANACISHVSGVSNKHYVQT